MVTVSDVLMMCYLKQVNGHHEVQLKLISCQG